MRDFTVITNLGKGRFLFATARGDQYWTEDHNGSKVQVSVQEAVKILEAVKQQEQAKPKRRRKRSAKQEPAKQESQVDTATSIAQKTIAVPARRLLQDFNQAIEQHVDKLERDLKFMDEDLDPSDRTPSLDEPLFHGVAQKLFAEIQKKKLDP